VKVFISWSGQRSLAVATALHDWLPNVLQSLEPWMSATDIEKGTRWSTDIGTQLAQARVGIICLTPENVKEAWVVFEAGALSKTLENTFVCTYLLDIEPADLRFPLALFQATKAEKEDTRKLLGTINRALAVNALPDGRLSEIFDVWWPKLHDRLASVPENPSPQIKTKRSEGEVLAEILELVRNRATEDRSSADALATAARRMEEVAVKSAHRMEEMAMMSASAASRLEVGVRRLADLASAQQTTVAPNQSPTALRLGEKSIFSERLKKALESDTSASTE